MHRHFGGQQATENKHLVSRKFACEFLNRDTSVHPNQRSPKEESRREHPKPDPSNRQRPTPFGPAASWRDRPPHRQQPTGERAPPPSAGTQHPPPGSPRPPPGP